MAATTTEWSGFLRSTKSLFQFCKTSLKWNVSGKGVTQASLEVQLQLCPKWAQEYVLQILFLKIHQS